MRAGPVAAPGEMAKACDGASRPTLGGRAEFVDVGGVDDIGEGDSCFGAALDFALGEEMRGGEADVEGVEELLRG